jgi:peptidoglycan/LPS O-acetylase OafA/YrhL
MTARGTDVGALLAPPGGGSVDPAATTVRDEGPLAPGREAGGLRRFSALDGIRALAVLAVLLYHAGISWMGGGLLGVDVFFVLSGFLITSLLCRELVRTATVRLGRFWAQRARRLLPALVITILGVAVYAYAFRDSLDVSAVRGDALATLFYVANWHFILSDQGYFVQAAAPSPLLHTWSLAVEEQYYLVWPLVVLAVARWFGLRAVAVDAVIGAVASASLMAALYAAGFSVDRLYYGTDTRVQALLIGSFLGAVGSHRGDGFSIVPAAWTSGHRRPWIWTGLGVAGAVYLAWAWHALAGVDPFLYRGGFFLVALAAGAVIVACVTVPASPVARVLSLRALVFVGRISYGLYLYHWPLFLAIDHAHTGLSGTPLLAVRLVATFAAATASFFLIEEPIRRGTLWRGRKSLGLAALALIVAAAAVLVATVTPATAAVAPPRHDGLSADLRRSLASTNAFTTDPVRFALFGDSVALTLGVGLNVDSVARYGVRVQDGASLGCDLDDTEVETSGVVGPATPGCIGWRTVWPQLMTRYHPEVTGLLLGRWEVSDHLYQGHWVHVGQPAWDRHLTAELDQAVDILSSGGARVILFTMPYVDPPVEAADGSTFSENDPSRMRDFNQILARVAAGRKGLVTLVDLNARLDPGGHYQAVVDGVTVRNSDGIHLTKAAGVWLQPIIMPTIATLGLAARSA